MPNGLERLSFYGSANISLLKAKSVTQLEIANANGLTKEELKWLESVKKVKKCDFQFCEAKVLYSLPSTVRSVHFSQKMEELDFNSVEIKKKLPYLIKLSARLRWNIIKQLNLRDICPIIEGNEFEMSTRPKKIVVDKKNESETIDKFPQLFEKVESVEINSNLFSLDCLPSSLKTLTLLKIDLKSKSKSRF